MLCLANWVALYNRAMSGDLFLGTWMLIPELSLYAMGIPPASGLYVIERVATGLVVRVEWTMQPSEPTRSTGFGGPDDGSVQAMPAGAPGPDGFSLQRIDERTLDSSAFREGKVIAYARRVASLDGQLLSVVQESNTPDGKSFRNFQVYRRAL